MANIKSSKKRILIGKRNRLQNQFYKSSVKTLSKLFVKDIQVYTQSQTLENKVKAKNRLNRIYKLLDKGTKRKVFHKNTAARKKAKLIAYYNLLIKY